MLKGPLSCFDSHPLKQGHANNSNEGQSSKAHAAANFHHCVERTEKDTCFAISDQLDGASYPFLVRITQPASPSVACP